MYAIRLIVKLRVYFTKAFMSQVEHINAQFKTALMTLCGNYSEDSLQRIAKSLNIPEDLQEKLIPHYVDSYSFIILVLLMV